MSRRVPRNVLLALALLVVSPASSEAHEVPARVTVLAFVRPAGGTLRMLIRVPLESMRDIEFPLRGPGYLVLEDIEPHLREAARLWLTDYLTIEADGVPLDDERIVAVRVSAPSDRSFVSYDDALANVTGDRLPAGTDLPWQQALLDVLLEVPISSDAARFSMHAAFAHLGVRTETVLRFRPPDGPERILRYDGDPGMVRLDPKWYQAFVGFVKLGFEHILGGLDHLLFILCLIIPIRRIRPIVAVLTAFTIAHSITLAASALGFAPTALWFPPLIEVLIALSIVWMAFENIVLAARPGDGADRAGTEAPGATRLRNRWRIAFVFGLVHGFGFSFLLRDSLQFAGTHLATSLLAFNIGVELGQILVVAVAVPLLALTFRRVPQRVGSILLSALVAHSAWHWMTDRLSAVREYRLSWPSLDVAFAVGVLRAVLLLLIAGAAIWLLSGLFERLNPTVPKGPSSVGAQREPSQPLGTVRPTR